MKKVRRVPRKVGHDDEDDADVSTATSRTSLEPTSAVKRPTLNARSSLKPNRSSSARTSFTIGAGTEDEGSSDGSGTSAVKKPPRKANLSRHVLERNAELTSQRLPLRIEEPSYSADYLAELKSSTPSTPRELTTRADDIGSANFSELDIASKFGEKALVRSVTEATTSAIPTDAEIREKKERRRRLAKEQEYISLNDGDGNEASQSDDSENDDPRHRSLIIPADEIKLRDKYGETRLEHEDEDIAEGFDSFVEDSGKVTLKGKAAKEQEKQRKNDIAAQIRSAQHGYGYGAGVSDAEDDDDDEDEVDEEEVARNAAYEAAQTRAGTYSMSNNKRWEKEKEESLRRRLEAQPKLRPIPDLKSVVGRFWESVKAKETELAASKKRLQAIEKEKEEIEKEEIRIQELLKEAGERYEKIRAEATIAATKKAETIEPEQDQQVRSAVESLASTPAGPQDEPESPASISGMLDGMGMRTFAGMGQVQRDEDDWN